MSVCKSSFRRKSFFRLVLVLIRVGSSSGDGGVKYLASSLTLDGPILRRGSSLMSCKLSFDTGVLVRGAVAFPAGTLLLDPMSLRRLRGYGGSGCEAIGGADTGLFGCCSICLCITRIRCLAPMMVLRVTACPILSCSWLMMLPMDLSISSISGEVDVELLAEVVPVLGLVTAAGCATGAL